MPSCRIDWFTRASAPMMCESALFMFSCGDHNTCAITQNTIAAPTSPDSAAAPTAGMATHPNRDVRR